MNERVFSGIQPTGLIHVGNYLGAIRSWVDVQERYESYFCIVDYHAITVPYDPADMQDRILDAVASNIAAGLDPEKCSIFVQSHVPEHTELCWLLTCLTPLGNLQRMTQFKEKSSRQPEHVSAGLMNYPILQAADILLYKASVIPVGEDQVQHLELSRVLARKFNHTFGETFPEPRPMLVKQAKIMALNDPEKKMSKSLPGSYIALSDEPEEIRAKIRRAVTDTGPSHDEMAPGVKNLFMLLEAFAPADTVRYLRDAYERRDLKYSELKHAVAEALVESLTPIRECRRELLARPHILEEIVAEGAKKARTIAHETMVEVKEKMGLVSCHKRA